MLLGVTYTAGPCTSSAPATAAPRSPTCTAAAVPGQRDGAVLDRARRHDGLLAGLHLLAEQAHAAVRRLWLRWTTTRSAQASYTIDMRPTAGGKSTLHGQPASATRSDGAKGIHACSCTHVATRWPCWPAPPRCRTGGAGPGHRAVARCTTAFRRAARVTSPRAASPSGSTAVGYVKTPGVVENKAGAGGRIALETLKSSPADGSVLAVTPMSPVSIYPHVFRKLAYDPPNDFAPGVDGGHRPPRAGRRPLGARERDHAEGLPGLGQGQPGQGGLRFARCRLHTAPAGCLAGACWPVCR